MSCAEDQACSDTLAAIRRWLALRLARLEANPPALSRILCAEAELNLDPNLQTALALTHVYEEALRIATLQRANAERRSRPLPAAARRSSTHLSLAELPEATNELEQTLRRVSLECDARDHCNDNDQDDYEPRRGAEAQEPAYN